MHSWADDQTKELTTELAGPWSSVTVLRMIDQGCVAPFHIGFRVRSIKGGLTITSWKKVKGREVEGVEQSLKSITKEAFCAALLEHYKAAVASLDIHERMAALPTAEERDAAAKASMSDGSMLIGGFGALGIDILIVKDGRGRQFTDSFGSTGWEAFERWMVGMTAQAEGR